MLWLDKPLWGRWLASAALICLAVWFESRPPPPAPAQSMMDSETLGAPDIPQGWWAFPTEVADGSEAGDRVLVLIVETGESIEGVVMKGSSDDPLGSGRGLVAVPPEHAPEAAAAAAIGNVVILHSTS